jgi:MOSC domain-containing protein YiiM
MGTMQDLKTPVLAACRVEHLYVSPGHRYFGRHGKEPLDFPAEEEGRVRCVARRGILGDRFYDSPEGHKGQVTFFSMEVYELMCLELGVADRAPSVLRRNVFVRNVELGSLIGTAFELQGVGFEGVEECKPCYWMDSAFGPGAEAFLRGRGGLRARVVTDGILRSLPA